MQCHQQARPTMQETCQRTNQSLLRAGGYGCARISAYEYVIGQTGEEVREGSGQFGMVGQAHASLSPHRLETLGFGVARGVTIRMNG